MNKYFDDIIINCLNCNDEIHTKIHIHSGEKKKNEKTN